MTTEIAKNQKRRLRIKIIWCLFIMISSILVINNPILAADLGIISVDLLQKNSSEWIIIDARPKNEWLSGHIPGARPFCWEDYTRIDEKGIPYRIMPPQKLAEALEKLGIDNQTPIVVYGDTDTSWGGEGWIVWTLTWLGHQGPVRLLNGGIQTWKQFNYPLKTNAESYTGKSLVYAYQIRENVNITAAEIQNNPSVYRLVDTRSFFERIRGRVPGSVHIFWEKFYNSKNRQPIGLSEVTALLRDYGLNSEKQVVYYCTGGIRSGYAWTVHTLAGLPAALNFEGGMAEWEKLIDN